MNPVSKKIRSVSPRDEVRARSKALSNPCGRFFLVHALVRCLANIETIASELVMRWLWKVDFADVLGDDMISRKRISIWEWRGTLWNATWE